MKKSPAGILLSDTLSGNQLTNIIDNLENSSNDIGEVTNNLSNLIKEIEDGDGALQYLTQNEKLVIDLDSTMYNIKESSYKLNENMEALKHNILFRGYFNKLERQKRRAERREERQDERQEDKKN